MLIILFQNISFFKEFLACNGCLRLYSEIKKGSETGFCCIFFAWFFHKNVPCLIFYQRLKFQCHTYSFSRYQTKCVIRFLFRQLMTSYTLRFFLDQPPKQWLRGTKRGGNANTKTWISRERQKLFRWNKKYFSQLLKGYPLVRNKNFIKNSGHNLWAMSDLGNEM